MMGATPAENNKLRGEDRAFHDWYRFVLSFPAHLVADYARSFGLDSGSVVLDPFCGTGTTLVECKKLGIASIGIESNPMASFATRVKMDWAVDPRVLQANAQEIAEHCLAELADAGVEDSPVHLVNNPKPTEAQLIRLPPAQEALLLRNSVSPLPMHKTLILLRTISEMAAPETVDHLRLALANAAVFSISNLRFGPEVGLGKVKADAAVVDSWLKVVQRMVRDLEEAAHLSRPLAHARVIGGDSRELAAILDPGSVAAVITSPPYPNEKDYTRTTRLESVLLGFLTSKEDLRRIKKGLLRSNTRGVYKADEDDQFVSDNAEIQEIAEAIERRRIELGKTSGFERLYARVTKLYFGGMARHLADMRYVLEPGAQLAYVVGDQASYLQVMIRTGRILADIAESLGYEVVKTDLFRTRIATATGEQLREEVVHLRWPS